MNIPDKVKVGAHWYDICLVDVVDKVSPRFGEADILNTTITIDRTVSRSIQEQCLLHEVIHVLEHLTGFEFSEEQVSSLASGIYCFLVDNDLCR